MRLHNGVLGALKPTTPVSKNGYCIYIYRGTAPSGTLERRKDFNVFDQR